LARRFVDMDTLMAATADEISAIDGFGGILADSVVKFFAEQGNIRLVGRLKDAGVNMLCSTPEVHADMPLSGKIFVLTGTLPTLDRATAKKMIEQAGGKATGSVSKKTHYVVAGDDAGGKLTKANEFGIAVITEDELVEMIGT
jgi:DNA ligase (NAD+)